MKPRTAFEIALYGIVALIPLFIACLLNRPPGFQTGFGPAALSVAPILFALTVVITIASAVSGVAGMILKKKRAQCGYFLE